MSQSVLVRVASGDQDALQECMDRYGSLVWYLARRMSNSVADAEDAAQEVFVELWRSASRFDPERASESTFITMIARRRLVDRFRKKSRERDTETLDEAMHLTERNISDDVEVQDEVAQVRSHMDRLKPDEKRVIELSILQGLSQGQIADTLSMPLGSVKTNARRGMMRLREMIFGTQLSGGQS